MVAASPGAFAQAAQQDAAPRDAPRRDAPATGTGDAWIDARIVDIDRYGARYREPLVDELVRYHDAPRALVVRLLDTRGWTPGAVYYACAAAHVAGRTCADVAARRRQDGWPGVADALGLQAGSLALVRIKRGMVESYRRWSRPAPDDAADTALPRERRSRAPGAGGATRRPEGATRR